MLHLNLCVIIIYSTLLFNLVKLQGTYDDDDYPIVTLPHGKVRGKNLITARGTRFSVFKGIPYARSPTGKYRFQPPEPPFRWRGFLNAFSDKRICPQTPKIDVPGYKQTENCLTVSVYAPRHFNKTIRLPVLFWIHGGGFINGYSSDDLYDPEHYMDHGAIVVKLNYRIGLLGFLATEDEVVPGNNGLKDQLLCLRWVNDNINLFGGDPKKVVIAGHDAGGASVSYHMYSLQSAQKYYRATIQMSGSALNECYFQRTPKKIAYKTAAYINSNITSENYNTSSLLGFFQNQTIETLIEASTKVLHEDVLGLYRLNGYVYTPVVEPNHKGGLITKPMFENTRYQKRVPQMLGFGSEEEIYMAKDKESFNKILKHFDEDSNNLVPIALNIVNKTHKQIVGNVVKQLYVKNGTFTENPGAAVRVSDNSVYRGVIKEARIRGFYTSIYLFNFAYNGTISQKNVKLIDTTACPKNNTDDSCRNYPKAEIVGHSDYLRYVFKQKGTNLIEEEPEERKKYHQMIKMITNYCKYLNPTPKIDPDFNNKIWPTPFPMGFLTLLYLDIDKNFTAGNHPRSRTFYKWDAMYRLDGNPPLYTF